MEGIIQVENTNRPTKWDIVKWFLLKENMNHKKIQKLCYYAQAWSYAINNEPLAPEMYFEAWVHGPVDPEIYQELKKFGWKEITINPDAIKSSKELMDSRLTQSDIDLLEATWSTYGELNANELEALTHQEKPWLEKRAGYRELERGTERISESTMREYYRSIANPGVLS